MSSARSQFKMSMAEYIEWEPLQTEKHEYWDGHVYLVLWQDRAKLELHTRTPEGYWLLREVSGIDQSVSLESLGGAKIALADIYDKIELSN